MAMSFGVSAATPPIEDCGKEAKREPGAGRSEGRSRRGPRERQETTRPIKVFRDVGPPRTERVGSSLPTNSDASAAIVAPACVLRASSNRSGVVRASGTSTRSVGCTRHMSNNHTRSGHMSLIEGATPLPRCRMRLDSSCSGMVPLRNGRPEMLGDAAVERPSRNRCRSDNRGP
jgi:hypothetical protein